MTIQNKNVPLDETVSLSMGAGGVETRELIENSFMDYLQNPLLAKAEDGAVLQIDHKIVMCADSFTVKPLFFSGGDIGKLAVAGLCNDLAVMGASPRYLSLCFILQEGFALQKLRIILNSIKKELEINGAIVAAADTKVVEHRNIDGIFISGSAIGALEHGDYSIYNALADDEIVISGSIGDHGTVILMDQGEFSMKSELQSDCRSLWPIIKNLVAESGVVAMRDITRGGLATILNEFSDQSGLAIEVQESKIPIKDQVRGFCEILGFQPFHLACEGNFVCVVRRGLGEKTRNHLREHGCPEAEVIGSFKNKETNEPSLCNVFLETAMGTRRCLEPVSGEMFPRIC